MSLGNFPLQYSGVNATHPKNVYTYQRAPTQFDNQNFVVGDTWIYQINTGTASHPNYSTSQIYHLVAQSLGLASWVQSDANTGVNLPNHSVALGTGISGLSSVGPSSTSGLPLVSRGSSTDPYFAALTVSAGGSGVTSLTAYAPIVGGTTTTGAVQQATTNFSTSGYVLTSTGSSSLPTWQPAAGAGDIFGIKIQYLSTPGTATYTPTVGMVQCTVECIGGGGGAGGVNGASGAPGGGGGGGAGAYCKSLFTAAAIGASQSYTVGAAGSGGIGSTSTNATAGGNTIFGSLITANGGGFGALGANSVPVAGGAGGSGSGASFIVPGQTGAPGNAAYVAGAYVLTGFGGGTIYGAGGSALQVSNAASGNGNSGTGYGSGGSGGFSTSGASDANGGAGSGGLIIITEYLG